MEFRSSNEKGARIKSHAPGPEFIWLLTSGCQEERFICDPVDANGRPVRKHLDGSRDDPANRDGRPNADEVRPTGSARASPDPDDMGLGPSRDDSRDGPSLDHHPIGCC